MGETTYRGADLSSWPWGQKLGFINGKTIKPKENSEEYEQWIKNDCLVTSWILNFISKEIVEAFLYTTSAQELSEELQARYGESNGLMIYQLQREIASASQGNMTVSGYYTKIKKLWDQLTCISPIPTCQCGTSKNGIKHWLKRESKQIQTQRALNTIEADFENSDAVTTHNAAEQRAMSEMDHKTKNIVAIGRMVGSLYVLEEQSFKEETIKAYQESKNASALNVTVTDIETWHKILGHSSSIFLSHLPHLKGPSSALIAEVKQYLDQLFTIKDLGVAKFFLGIEIACSPQGMALTQLKYTKDILADTGMTNAQAATLRCLQGGGYRSMGAAAYELTWIYFLLKDMQLSVEGSVRGGDETLVEAGGCHGPAVEELAHISHIVAIISTIIVSNLSMQSSMAEFGLCGVVSMVMCRGRSSVVHSLGRRAVRRPVRLILLGLLLEVRAGPVCLDLELYLVGQPKLLDQIPSGDGELLPDVFVEDSEHGLIVTVSPVEILRLWWHLPQTSPRVEKVSMHHRIDALVEFAIRSESYRCRTRGPTLSGVCGAAEGSVMSGGGGGRKTTSPAQKTLDDTAKNGRLRLPPQP
ncbi:UNVERIFIED_CONTAM: hypothetical protein Scaly_0607500 [Sesamum calycinum]|uniref:Reverse transcriptase Ty1/copia-type domain-containing protein n=1 Tax=Sesamum calycinum TaxID=2727403 RepID=A0AAW2RSM6_9LAMI